MSIPLTINKHTIHVNPVHDDHGSFYFVNDSSIRKCKDNRLGVSEHGFLTIRNKYDNEYSKVRDLSYDKQTHRYTLRSRHHVISVLNDDEPESTSPERGGSSTSPTYPEPEQHSRR